MLIYTAAQLENWDLLVNSTCGAQTPITNHEEVIVKMRLGLNIAYSCQIISVLEVISGLLPMP